MAPANGLASPAGPGLGQPATEPATDALMGCVGAVASRLGAPLASGPAVSAAAAPEPAAPSPAAVVAHGGDCGPVDAAGSPPLEPALV